MKIAQIAPLTESCPPRLYGGSERIISYLTEELVDLGHDVTLFATGDSKTSAELVACTEIGLRLNPKVHDPLPHHIMMLEQLRQRAHEFDVLHFHIHILHFPIIHQDSQAHPGSRRRGGRGNRPSAPGAAGAGFAFQPVDEINDVVEAPSGAGADAGPGDRDCMMTFTGPGSADQDGVALLG
jgi:hypothetical protein